MAYIGTKIVDDCVMLSSWSCDHQNNSNGPSIDLLSSLCQTEAGTEAEAEAGKEEENSTSLYQRDINKLPNIHVFGLWGKNHSGTGGCATFCLAENTGNL